MRLIELKKQYEAILCKLESLEDIDLEAELNLVAHEYEDKLEACGWIYRNLMAESEAFSSEGKRLLDRAIQLEKNAIRLKDYIAYCLAGASCKTKTFSFSFRKSEAVEVFDPALVPEQYQRVKREPDKALIKQDLKSGATIPGCGIIDNLNLQIK